MNFKQQLIQRHKNPIGLVIRVVTYFLIGIALWKHKLGLILLLFFIDLLNWFFMPMVKPKHESTIINAIIEKEIAWIESQLSPAKIMSIVTGTILFILLTIGLWNHSWLLLLVAFLCLVILKQLMLKFTKSQNK